MSLFNKTGFTIHPEKSVLEPVQKIAFLGFLIDSIKMIVTLTPEKASELAKLCAETIRKREITIRVFVRIIGKMIAAEPAVQYAPFHYIVLKNEKERCLKSKKGNFDAKLTLSEIARRDLNWWFENIHSSFCAIVRKPVDTLLQTDSSGTGWGAYLPQTNRKAGGHWSYIEQKLHINFWCIEKQIWISATHLPGRENVHADRLSRK